MTYPELTYPEVYKVQTVGINLKDNPDYIKNSPYSNVIKDALTYIFVRNSEEINKLYRTNILNSKELNLEDETLNVYLQTKELLDSGQLETTEKIRVLQTQTNLLEKQLTLQERAKNLRYVQDLENALVKVCKTLDEDKRREIIQILKNTSK